MILPELLPVLAIHLYALGTAAVVAGILARNEWLKRAALVLTVLAFTTHTLLLIATFMDDGFTGLTRSVYVQLLAWCITLSGLVAWLRWRYEALLLTVAPFSLLTFLIALLLRHAETPLPPVLSGMTFTLQIKAGGLPKGSPCPLRIGQNQCVHDDGRLSAVHGGRAFWVHLGPHQLGHNPFRRS